MLAPLAFSLYINLIYIFLVLKLPLLQQCNTRKQQEKVSIKNPLLLVQGLDFRKRSEIDVRLL